MRAALKNQDVQTLTNRGIAATSDDRRLLDKANGAGE